MMSRRRLKTIPAAMGEDVDTMAASPVNKRLNFSLESPAKPASNNNGGNNSNEFHQPQFDIEMEDICMDGSYIGSRAEISSAADSFSPCRTRSGCVYDSGLKKNKFRMLTSTTTKKAPTAAAVDANGDVGAAAAVTRRTVVAGDGGPSNSARTGGKKSARARIYSGQSGTGSIADCSENDSDDIGKMGGLNSDLGYDRLFYSAPRSPPRLNYTKVPVSRFSQVRERRNLHELPSSPLGAALCDPQDRYSPVPKPWDGRSSPLLSFSPPTNTMRDMRLFDGLGSPNTACALNSPRSASRGAIYMKSRLLFDEEGGEHRRASCPVPYPNHIKQILECDSTSSEKKKMANINPFTPSAMFALNRKRSRSKRSSVGSSREELQHSLDSFDEDEGDEPTAAGGRFSPLPAKRVRVSDINITRYEEEFLELGEIASGQFGFVKKARHRLDGMVYAVKVTKKPLRINSHDEKMAMNEVFAHAAIIKHKHVVRYYNSWVEKGQVYIQNEFCEGGSLQRQIEEMREGGTRFSEAELKRIIIHVAKGLSYFHSKQLVHLDIKPGNIFISLEFVTPSPAKKTEQSTDSGAASGDQSPLRNDCSSPDGVGANSANDPAAEKSGTAGSGTTSNESSPGGENGEKIHYKIGDLGHVASVYGGDVDPEEGDCRYMAPEFLEMEVDRSKLPKADIFSLGLTIYEAASLKVLPRNSLDDPIYEKMKNGELPYLDNYSREFNNLLRTMVQPDPCSRPSAAKLLANSSLNPTMNKSRSQLYKELKEAREKVALLEQQLISQPGPASTTATATTTASPAPSLPYPHPHHHHHNLHHHQDKENSAPGGGGRGKLAKRLVGRGTAKATSCVL